MRTTLLVPAALVSAALLLAGCSDSASSSADSGDPGSSSSAPATSGSGDTGGTGDSATSDAPTTATGTTVDITIKGDQVTPNGKRVKAKAGQPVTLRIEADRGGELHVHSSPEQEIEFGSGRSTKKLVVDQPGIVDVEDHALERVVVQLEVG